MFLIPLFIKLKFSKCRTFNSFRIEMISIDE